MKKKRLLLLGGSSQQVIAIEKAKALGYETVLCDYLSDNPGQYFADKFYNVSTTDIDAVYDVALKESVDGILAYSSDPAALPAAVVATRLGLPTNPVESVEILGLKYKFREFLKNNGFPCPNFFVYTASDLIETIKIKSEGLSLPFLIKPTDCSGSKGITVVNNRDEISHAIEVAKGFSRNGVFVCEEYIKRGYPNVIEVELFVEDGRILLMGLTASLRSDKNDGLLPLGYLWQTELDQRYVDIIRDELQKIIDILKIKGGEMNVELIINEEGQVQFIEIGPRAGGNMMPIILSDAFGCDLVKANINIALGLPSNVNPKEIEGKYCLYVIHSETSGVFKRVVLDREIEKYVYRINYYRQPGERVEAYNNAWNAIGMMFLHFPDAETAGRLFPKMKNLVKVDLE